MSLKKLKEACDSCKEEYVYVPAADLVAALKEAADPELEPLLKSITDQMESQEKAKRPPLGKVGVHKTRHLGKLLGIPALPLET